MECIDWRSFAYRQSPEDSASLPKVPRARTLEDTLQDGEPAAAGAADAPRGEATATPSSAPQGADAFSSDYSGSTKPAAASVEAAVIAEGQSSSAELIAEPVTPSVRLASLHDKGGGRSGWLSFGASSNEKSASASRSRGSHGGRPSKANKSIIKSSSRGGKQRSAVVSVLSAQPQGIPVVKKRKLLRGGVAACGSLDGDVESAHEAPPCTGGSTRVSSRGRSPCRSAASSRSESEESDGDEESLDALHLCLQESEAMTTLLVEELGGATEEGRAQVRTQIGDGRCHCRTSLAIPETLLKHCGEGWDRLKDYQKCGVHWLATMHKADRNGILADEMGLVSLRRSPF